MHPQIMQPEPGNCPICGMELIPTESSSGGLSPAQFRLTENAIALANIRTMQVGDAEASAGSLTLSGKIMENEEANLIQASYFGGRIDQLNVSTTGVRIIKGQLLATIYSPELVAAQQELLTAAKLKTTQPALYTAVRNKLKLWKLSDIQIDAIEESTRVKENFPVYATVSGTVTEKLVQEGDYVKQGQALFRIANLKTVWAVFDAYEHQLGFLKEKQVLQITARAFPNREFNGKISLIDPIMDTKRRTVEVRTELNNELGLLKPGMFITARIEGDRDIGESAVMVPASSVMWTGERSVVYVKANQAEPVFEMREVLLGSSTGDMEQVLEGLQPGEQIVVNGTFTVDAAAQLLGKKSMMNPEGGKTTTGHEGHTDMQKGSAEIPTSEKEGLAEAIRALQNTLPLYLVLKDALVADDGSAAASAALAFSKELKTLEVSSLGREKHLILQKAAELAGDMAETTELDTQRDLFVKVNSAFIPLVKSAGIAGQTIYIQHCPMADNNQGAYWLSLEKGIRNPYYGESMLTCGSIKDSIK